MAAAFVLSTLGSAPVSAQEAESRAPGLVAAEAVTTVTVDPASASFTVQHTYRLSNTAMTPPNAIIKAPIHTQRTSGL